MKSVEHQDGQPQQVRQPERQGLTRRQFAGLFTSAVGGVVLGWSLRDLSATLETREKQEITAANKVDAAGTPRPDPRGLELAEKIEDYENPSMRGTLKYNRSTFSREQREKADDAVDQQAKLTKAVDKTVNEMRQTEGASDTRVGVDVSGIATGAVAEFVGLKIANS